MAQTPLTPKEKRFYEFVQESIRRNGYAPTVRDVQKGLNIKSTSTVHSYVQKLVEKGYLQKASGKSRALRADADTSSPSRRTAHVPIIGRVTAGAPILAQENYEDYLDFPLLNSSLLHSQLFALRVSGYSMKDAGILDDDIVVVSRTDYAENGDIVVALLDDEATVKRFFKEDGHFRLQPENPEFEPIIADDVYILGKVVSVVRFYNN